MLTFCHDRDHITFTQAVLCNTRDGSHVTQSLRAHAAVMITSGRKDKLFLEYITEEQHSVKVAWSRSLAHINTNSASSYRKKAEGQLAHRDHTKKRQRIYATLNTRRNTVQLP